MASGQTRSRQLLDCSKLSLWQLIWMLWNAEQVQIGFILGKSLTNCRIRFFFNGEAFSNQFYLLQPRNWICRLDHGNPPTIHQNSQPDVLSLRLSIGCVKIRRRTWKAKSLRDWHVELTQYGDRARIFLNVKNLGEKRGQTCFCTVTWLEIGSEVIEDQVGLGVESWARRIRWFANLRAVSGRSSSSSLHYELLD